MAYVEPAPVDTLRVLGYVLALGQVQTHDFAMPLSLFRGLTCFAAVVLVQNPLFPTRVPQKP